MKKIIYFDNAATTFPKPESVYRYADRFVRGFAGNPGRASHSLALAAAEEVYRAREALANLFSASPDRICFVMNTTQALNTAIKASVGANEHVLISNYEHNSVLRPVNSVCRERGSSYGIFNLTSDEDETLYNIKSLLRKNTKTIVCTHHSNICPVIAPIRKIGELCYANGITFIVDAAQSAGILDINVERDHIDMLCIPGHKGLYGFGGCGALIFGNNVSEMRRTLIEGGSGSNSIPIDMPDYLPDRFEAGTLPTPAICALGEGARWISERGISTVHDHECALCSYIMEGIGELDGVRIYNDRPGSMLLFNIDPYPASEIGMMYNEENICVRAGLHCAPLAHKSIGTFPLGAVRASFGAFNTLADARRFVDVTKAIVSKSRR